MDMDQQANNDFSVDLEDPEQADNSGAVQGGVETASPPTARYFPGWTPKNIKKKAQPLRERWRGCGESRQPLT